MCGILPGVAFALRTYPRLKTAIAFAIESQPNSLRFDTPVRRYTDDPDWTAHSPSELFIGLK